MANRKVRDSGWSPQVKALLRSKSLSVGIHETNAARSDGASNAQIGMFHEFGMGLPMRSFLREPFDRGERSYRTFIGQVFAKIARGLISIDQGLTYVGMKMEADIKNRIRSNIPPELSEQTVARKGSSVALIDSGQLINSITYEIGPARSNP